MSGIVLQQKAFKITNKGGGVFGVPGTKVKDDGNKDHIYAAKDTGSDYVHWQCPKCDHRNKTCVYSHEGYVPANENVIPFKCKMCRVTVEVGLPPRPVKQENLLVTPEQFTREMAQRRQELRRG